MGRHFASGPEPEKDTNKSAAEVKDSKASGSGAKAKKGRRRLIPLIVILVVCLIAAACGGIFLFQQYQAGQQALVEQESAPKPETETDDEETLEPNPIDFTTLQSETPDLYAWIYIPNTNVNLPIMRSPVDDNYYLRRDTKGNDSVYGSIFTQSMNALDFSDPVTVVYGHATNNGSMFDDLRKYQDKDFFDQHPDIYIYTPGHILHYQVISAYMYDDRHILNSFDFSDPTVRQQYFDSVLNPTSMTRNVREGATLDVDSKIIQLSTCPYVPNNSPLRYIVTGVLVDDQPTL